MAGELAKLMGELAKRIADAIREASDGDGGFDRRFEDTIQEVLEQYFCSDDATAVFDKTIERFNKAVQENGDPTSFTLHEESTGGRDA